MVHKAIVFHMNHELKRIRFIEMAEHTSMTRLDLMKCCKAQKKII